MKVIETNIDDMNPEFYEHVMGELFRVGAVDVFFTPSLYEKKSTGNTSFRIGSQRVF